jgi:hypothetical protein
MRSITKVVRVGWTQLLSRKYAKRRARDAQQARDSAERIRMAEEGIDPYGPPKATF